MHYNDSKEIHVADRIALGISMGFVTFGASDYKPKFDPMLWENQDLDEFYAFLKHDISCLQNFPSKIIASCGNGFAENEEECDCGLPESCKNSCCDPTTCKKRSNAVCASGKCCNLTKCQIFPGSISLK